MRAAFSPTAPDSGVVDRRHLSRARVARIGAAALVATVLAPVAAVFGPLGAPAGAAPSQPTGNVNHPAYWEALGHGQCEKDESVPTPYTLPPPPGGHYWSLLVLKAGSAASTSDWLTQVPNPLPGSYFHPSGKDISYVIYCKKPTSGTTTTSAPASSTTTTGPPAPTTTIVGGGCDDYTPTALSLSSTAAEPGASVVVSGSGVPGDNLVITIRRGAQAPATIGYAVVDGFGHFSESVVIPDDYNPGNYTITVSSNACTATTTIRVLSVDLSGCGANSDDRVFFAGESFAWHLMGPPFETNKPVSLVLESRSPGGPDFTIYSGPYPGSMSVQAQIPAGAPMGQYYLHQVGVKKGNHKAMTRTCPVRVGLDAVLATSIDDGSGARPAVNLGVVGAGVLLLTTLRFRRRRTH